MAIIKKLMLIVLTIFTTNIYSMEDPSREMPHEETDGNQFRYKPNNGEKAEVNFEGHPDVTINNMRTPIFFNNRHRQPGKDKQDEDEDARREGELKAAEHIAFQKIFSEYASSPDAASQKKKAIDAHIDMNAYKNKIAHNYAQSPEAQQILSEQIDIALKQQDMVRQKVPMAKRVEIAQDEAVLKFETEKKLQDLILNYQLNPDNEVRTREFAKQQGIASAIGQLAAKEYIRKNDVDQTFKGRFKLVAQEITIRLLAELMITAVKQGGSILKSTLYNAYLNLPVDHCKELKEQQKMIRMFKAMQTKQKLLTKEKQEIQTILETDSKLLNDNWKEIQQIKTAIDQSTDDEEKEKLQEAYQALRKSYIEAAIQHSALVQLNLNHQPQMNRLIMHQMNNQKMAKKAHG